MATPLATTNGGLRSFGKLGVIAGITLGTAVLSLPALCPFRVCTGQACPGCGLTRSAVSLVRGDVGESWRYHPLLVPIVAQFVVLLAIRRSGWHPGSPDASRLSIVLFTGFLAVNAVLLIGVWLLRWRLGLLDFVVAE